MKKIKLTSKVVCMYMMFLDEPGGAIYGSIVLLHNKITIK